MREKLKVRWLGVVRRNDLLLDALERHFAVEESEDAQVVFCGEGVSARQANKGAVTFFVPIELCWPPLSEYDYSFGFLHRKIPRYYRLPNYVLEYPAAALMKDARFVDRVMEQPRDFCSFVVSNGNPRRTFQRINFFQLLHAKKEISSAGALFNNVGPLPPGTDALGEFIGRHRFHIAMENKSWQGYATEKITSAMAAGSIPIYWASPTIEHEFNPASFIHIRRFSSLLEARDAVVRLSEDRDALARMLREPWFHNNTPNTAYSLNTLSDFLSRSIHEGVRSKRRYFPSTWAYKHFEKISGRVRNLGHRIQAGSASE